MTDEDERPADPPAVVDGRLLRLSVSQMQLADAATGGCLRKWRLSKVEKPLPKVEGAGQKRGKAGHKRIELFLKTADRAHLEHLELVGLERGLIPVPGPGLLIEHPIHLPVAKLFALDVPLAGYVDLVVERAAIPKLVDWKFKKPWDGRLGFEAADLVNPLHEAGIQMIGYAAWLERVRAFEAVDLGHVTFQTTGRADVRPVTARLARAEIAPLWESIAQRIVPKVHAAAAAFNWRDVEPNEKVCGKYGGCQYQMLCFDRMALLVAGFKKGSPKMGMLNEMLNTAAAPPATQPAPGRSLAIQSQGLAQGVMYAPNGTRARFVCNVDIGGAIHASFAPETGGPPILLAFADADKLTALPATQAAPIVTPPDVPKSDPALAAKPAPGTLPAAAEKNIAAAAETKAPEAPAAEKKTRARKTDTADGVCLYFGCTPVGVATTTLHSYVESLDAALQKHAQVDLLDLRTANDQAFGFGRWRGFLAKAALETPPPAGHYVVSPGDERIECVANALIPTSKVVIGGGR